MQCRWHRPRSFATANEKGLCHSLYGASAGFNSERMKPNSGVKQVAIHTALVRSPSVYGMEHSAADMARWWWSESSFLAANNARSPKLLMCFPMSRHGAPKIWATRSGHQMGKSAEISVSTCWRDGDSRSTPGAETWLYNVETVGLCDHHALRGFNWQAWRCKAEKDPDAGKAWTPKVDWAGETHCLITGSMSYEEFSLLLVEQSPASCGRREKRFPRGTGTMKRCASAPVLACWFVNLLRVLQQEGMYVAQLWFNCHLFDCERHLATYTATHLDGGQSLPYRHWAPTQNNRSRSSVLKSCILELGNCSPALGGDGRCSHHYQSFFRYTACDQLRRASA